MPYRILALMVVGQAAYAFVLYALLWGKHEERGTFGDMFGGYTALVSGASFAFLIYSIILQRRELALTREEFRGQKEELRAQAAAQQAQVAAAERAHVYAAAPLIVPMVVHETRGIWEVRLANLSPHAALDIRTRVVLKDDKEIGATWTDHLREGLLLPAAKMTGLPHGTLLAVHCRYANIAGGLFEVARLYVVDRDEARVLYFQASVSPLPLPDAPQPFIDELMARSSSIACDFRTGARLEQGKAQGSA